MQEGGETTTPGGTVVPDRTGGELLVDRVVELLSGAVPEPLIVLAFTVLLVVGAYYGAGLLTQLLGRRIARRFARQSVSRTVLRLLRLSVFVGAAVLVINLYGIDLGNVALSVTVFSAVVGIVLAPIVGSIIAGVFVLADQPFEVGDMIEIVDTGQRGFVDDITLRYTKIFTLDNTFLVVPNGAMRDRDVINYSAEDARTRLSLDITVTYEGDLAQARRLIEQAAVETENVIEGGPDIRIGSARYPARPVCYIDSFADHGIALRLRYWVQEPYKLLTMRSTVQSAVWEKLADANVEIAYPHSHLLFDDTSGTLNVEMGPRRGAETPMDGPGPERGVDPGDRP